MTSMMRRKALIFILLAARVCLGWGGNTFEIIPIATAWGGSSQEQTTPFGRNEVWNLIFSDEFLGTSLDPDKWTTCYWWDDNGCTIASNAELQWYQPDDVLVEDGILKLRAQKKSINVYKRNTQRYTRYDYT